MLVLMISGIYALTSSLMPMLSSISFKTESCIVPYYRLSNNSNNFDSYNSNKYHFSSYNLISNKSLNLKLENLPIGFKL